MGFKDKIVGSALNNSNIKLDQLQNNISGIEFDLSKVDPCSDKPFNSSFKDILKELLGLFKVLLPPAPFISAEQIVMATRGGMSAIEESAEFLEALKSMGIPIGTYVDGTPNYTSMVDVAGKEIHNKHVIEKMKIQAAIKPGSMLSKGVGVGAAGPVDVSVFNVKAVKAEGHAR